MAWLLPPLVFLVLRDLSWTHSHVLKKKQDLKIHYIWEMHLPDTILVIMEAGPGIAH